MEFYPYRICNAKNKMTPRSLKEVFLHPKMDGRNEFLLLHVSNLKCGSSQAKGTCSLAL